MLEPEKLINPRAKTGDGALELRETEHYYLDLSKLEPDVKNFLRERAPHMRDTVLGESLGKIESEGLKSRSITRDLDWGIPVPVDEGGWETKKLYVWFEAVIGYLSAPIEWSQVSGQKEAWREWWANPAAKQFHFIGKDNILFHTSQWPAELMGAGSAFMALHPARRQARDRPQRGDHGPVPGSAEALLLRPNEAQDLSGPAGSEIPDAESIADSRESAVMRMPCEPEVVW